MTEGKQCSSQFSVDYLRTTSLNNMELTGKELDLVVQSNLSAFTSNTKYTSTSNGHHSKGKEVCTVYALRSMDL